MIPNQQSKGAPSVVDLVTSASAFKLARAIQTAALWGLFEALSEASLSLAELAARLQRPRKVIEALAAALVPAGVLVHEKGLLSIDALHKATVAPGGHRSMLNYIKWMGHQYSQFEQLIDADYREPDWSLWMGCLEELACRDGYVDAVTACLPLENVTAVLDLGGGSGVYARSLCERFPKLRVTVFDRNSVAEIARKRLTAWGLTDRVRVVSGDFQGDALPIGHDAVFASNVLHGKSEACVIDLMKKVFRALDPGGLFIVHGQHIDVNFKHSVDAGLLHLTMAVNGGGSSYTVDHVRHLGEQAGFEMLTTVSPRGEHTPDLLIMRSPLQA